MSTHILRAPNGDWLVLQGGAQDRLLGIAKTKREAQRLQQSLERKAA